MYRYYHQLRFSRMKIPVAIIAVMIITLATVSILTVSRKDHLGFKLQFSSVNQPVNAPFVIDLNKKVRDVDLNSLDITPKILGKWELRKGNGLINDDKLVFIPKESFRAGTQYKVTPIKVQRYLFGDDKVGGVSFKTEPAPGINDTGLIALEDGSTIPADYLFVVSLRDQHGDRDVQLRTNPSIQLIKKSVDKGNFEWRAQGLLPQGQSVTVEIYDAKNDAVLATKRIKVADEPKISFNKPDHFNPGDIATISFSDAIKSPKSDSISFDIPGVGKWQSPSVYTFTPNNIVPGAKYNYKIKSGLRSGSGGVLLQDYIGSFYTTGAVSVTASSPRGYELSQASQVISFTFDQPVDKSSVSERFSVSSGSVTDIFWQGNTFNARVSNLGYQRTITAAVGPGVKNSSFGLPSTQYFRASFTTEARITKYAVPFYRQQYTASCAAASLRMILAYRGINAGNDMNVIQRMGYNPRPMDTSTDPPKWDDPSVMFVGDAAGSLSKKTAAGPDAGPVVAASQSYGRNAFMATGIDVTWIANQLTNGRLVVMFGAINNSTNFLTWQTPSGRTEVMNAASHSRAIIGVKGEPNSPIGFWVNDPYSSGVAYWTAEALQANINLDAYHQAVAVE